MTLSEVENAMRRAIRQGLEAAVEKLAEEYREDIGSPPPPSSSPQEYPHVATGQGIENISSGVNDQGDEARAGAFGEEGAVGPIREGHDRAGGEHLFALASENQRFARRLGMDSTFFENVDEIERAFREGAKR